MIHGFPKAVRLAVAFDTYSDEALRQAIRAEHVGSDAWTFAEATPCTCSVPQFCRRYHGLPDHELKNFTEPSSKIGTDVVISVKGDNPSTVASGADKPSEGSVPTGMLPSSFALAYKSKDFQISRDAC
jgi:hypothetical protein